jgi:hypothetical protein
MEILAAYDLTGSFRDAAALVGCDHHTVARYVRAREAGGLETTPVQREQLINPFREKLEEWVEASRGRIRADVAQRKLESMGYTGSERTTRRAVAEAKAVCGGKTSAERKSAMLRACLHSSGCCSRPFWPRCARARISCSRTCCFAINSPSSRGRLEPDRARGFAPGTSCCGSWRAASAPAGASIWPL